MEDPGWRMNEREFNEKYPVILGWIEQTLAAHQSQAQRVGLLGFKRLREYFSPGLLNAAQVVYISAVPVPPLRALGFNEFADFEDLDSVGITYFDTFFSREEMRGNEAHHFHELVHVVQWRLLGARNFLAAYAYGLLQFGYRESPLETMAYALEDRFRQEAAPFDAEWVIQQQLPRM
jgi:hypothetical protein